MGNVHPNGLAIDAFIHFYYIIRDTRRDFVELLYHEFAVLDWNGTELYGREAIKNHCTALPPSRHHLTSVDCVYLQMNESPNIKLYHVIIGGEVTLGGEAVRNFNHNYLFSIENDIWQVILDYYRES
ncbi:NTF2-related export protein [Drosophila grimshawi]|uniref:NTF2-related export protein n=1 Tax=Drosophila grimshawi TaxID=7222 RepID=UPI000C86E57C|nr:NTF2-related export protein [Drosophila grimshawi]